MAVQRISLKPILPKLLMLISFVLLYLVFGWSYMFSDGTMYMESLDMKQQHPMCDVNCTTGTPCEYLDEVDLRIIVLTHGRPASLRLCLDKLHDLDTLGDKVVVDIWIDRWKDGQVHKETVDIALKFQQEWKGVRTCVHLQTSHAYIIGQWVDTWRPRVDSKEMALLLEDDIDISPMTYRWLKAVHGHFHVWDDVGGYTLQMENVKFVQEPSTDVRVSKHAPVFLYYLPSTWGYAPTARHWRDFQDWFHKKRQDPSFHPYMPGIRPNKWFVDLEKQGRADSMWEMWSIYYFYHQDLLSVHPNLVEYTGRQDVLLEHNRRERGLHYGMFSASRSDSQLLRTWDDNFVKFPKTVDRYDLAGKLIHR